MKSEFYELSEGRIHYKTGGEKENDTIIFLHGFPEFWYSWKHQLAYFSKEYHVVAPDMRGYNLSLKPTRVEEYKIDIIANDILNLIDHLGQRKVYLVGHDWGAAIAWHLLLLHGERFHKGVILNVPHPIVFKNKLFTSLRQLSKSWYMFFFQIPFLPTLLLGRNNYQQAAKMLLDSSNEGSFSESDLEKYKTAWKNEESMKHMIMWYKAALRNPSQAMVYENKKVEVPLKIIWGKNDLALVPEMAEESLEFCTNGELVYLEEATHWVQHDCPEKVNWLIEGFFKK